MESGLFFSARIRNSEPPEVFIAPETHFINDGNQSFSDLCQGILRFRRNDRIELAFDNHRFWDIRRWMIAEEEGVMQGNMWGIQVSRIEGNDSEYHYEPYVFETRNWNRRGYLHPFSTAEINKGYLVQNPGY